MSSLQIQEAPIHYLVKLEGGYARFIWSSNPWSPLEGSTDLKVRVNPIELFYLVDTLNCPAKDVEILPPTLELYSRLLIYASVRPTVRNGVKARDLAQLVLDLNSLDTHYWSSRFRELWWRHGCYRPLMKTSKSFKLFFGLD
jgi:hypothetical protein